MKPRKRKKRWSILKHSRYKMVVYFKNKAARKPGEKDESSTFYSFDWKSGYSRNLDRKKGLAGFHRLIAKWGSKANYIVIYDRHTNTLIEKYYEGHPVPLRYPEQL